jgi:homocysteine S-methyltransferase
MARYRDNLPQLGERPFLTDSGLETSLVYIEGKELPCFAVFPLLRETEGRAYLDHYYRDHAQLAVARGAGFVLESVSWRANSDWGTKLGYDAEALAEANRDSVGFLEEIREDLETPESPMVISGCLGPRGDGYDPGELMSREEARDYHGIQIGVLAGTEADLVTAMTMTHSGEAAGIALAAREARIPSVLSFTVETDGRLPSGQPLGEAIEEVDRISDRAPEYFMINCAHPTHFADMLGTAGDWKGRIRGVRANSSSLSHEELDSSTELDSGDAEELARQSVALRSLLPRLTVLGGCCGTDRSHVQALAHAWLP